MDSLYIGLIEGSHECRTLRLGDDVALNIGSGEQLVGIEILDARRVLGGGNVPELVVENLPKTGLAFASPDVGGPHFGQYSVMCSMSVFPSFSTNGAAIPQPSPAGWVTAYASIEP